MKSGELSDGRDDSGINDHVAKAACLAADITRANGKEKAEVEGAQKGEVTFYYGTGRNACTRETERESSEWLRFPTGAARKAGIYCPEGAGAKTIQR